MVIPHTKPMTENNVIRIFTDGSCLSNPGGPGGFASVILLPDGTEILLSGREVATTNNRMELMAALSSLNYLDSKQQTSKAQTVIVFTDSRYLRNIFEKGWISCWQLNGWKTSENKDVQNKDLIEILDWLVNRMKVRFDWVKSHNGNRFNEKADKLAFEEASKAAKECGFKLTAPAKSKPFFPAAKRPAVTVNPKSVLDTPIKMGNFSLKSKEYPPKEKPVQTKDTSPKGTENKEFLKTAYRTVPVGKQKKKNGQKASPGGGNIKKASVKVELHNGNIITLPISLKQAELVNLVLGIEAQDDGMNFKVFDDTTLDRMFSAKENPLAVLLKTAKNPSFYKISSGAMK